MKRLITFLSTMLLLLMLVPKTAGAKTVYVKYTGSGELKIHYWGGTSSSGYPGNKMNKVAGTTNWYSYDVNTSTNFLVNTNGDNDKTANLSFPTDEETCYLTYNGKDNYTSVTGGIPSDLSKKRIQVDFYVKKVGTAPMGLYVWTDGTDDADHKWLGDWAATEKNLTNLYTDNNSDKWYKYTASIPEDEKIRVIVRQGSNQSQNSDVFTISSSDKVFYLEWNGSGNKTNPVNSVDRSGMTFTEFNYYLIVPNANVGNTNRYVPSEEFAAPAGHKAFRLKASRERNSTVINNDLTTLALKLDGRQLRYNTKGEIEFYIQSSDGTVYMQPEDNNDDTYIKLALKARNDVDYYATRTGTYSSNQNRYYKIHKNDTNPTNGSVDTKTLVFMFSKDNASKTAHINNDNKNVPISNGNSIDGVTTGQDNTGKDLKYNVGKTGNLIVGFLMSRGAGSKYYEDHIKGNGLYLVGSIAQTNYTHDKSHPMEQIYWKDGRIVELSDLGDDEAKADSIVYNCLVRNTGRSWDDFFLSFSTGDVVKGTGLWNLLLRPCVQDQMDAQELGGGVTFYQYDGGDKNNGQSLNPLLSEEQKKNYASYRVYFNATYSTYRIEFYDNFCIAGPAVNGQSNDTSKSGTYFDADHRHGMLEETVNGRKCYRYRGEFKKGSTFAFFVNPKTSALYYCEDDDNAAVNKDYTTGYNDDKVARWHVQAPVGENGVATGADYPYHNKVAWNNDGSPDINNPALGAGNAILWTLPDGVYTLRFYNHEGNTSDVDHTKALYTIDKEVVLKNMSSTFEVWNDDKTALVSKTFEYGGVRTFSDDCALMLPLGVKAYYANSIDEEKGKVILKEVADNIIPAHCPVIIYDLSMKAGYNGLGRTAVKTINLCPVPNGYKEKLAAGEKNYLVDCYDKDNVIQTTEDKDGTTMFNFFLSNQVYRNGDFTGMVSAPLNFWRARPGATAKKNYTYLSVEEDIRPVFYTSDKNYVRPDESEDIANSKRNYCFILSFGDVDDDTVVTSITSVNAGDKTADSDAWYTIQGIRIAAPVVPGMYIHNGKKVVLK